MNFFSVENAFNVCRPYSLKNAHIFYFHVVTSTIKKKIRNEEKRETKCLRLLGNVIRNNFIA